MKKMWRPVLGAQISALILVVLTYFLYKNSGYKDVKSFLYHEPMMAAAYATLLTLLTFIILIFLFGSTLSLMVWLRSRKKQ